MGESPVSDVVFCVTLPTLCYEIRLMPHPKPLIAYDASKKCLMTPGQQSNILNAHLLNQQGYQGKGLLCPRISASIMNFVRLMDPGYTVDSL